jgi:ribosomal protein S18 acetylase RimI-like enzyme
MLVAAAGSMLVAAGYAEMVLIVREANEPAVALYRELRQVDRLTEPADLS